MVNRANFFEREKGGTWKAYTHMFHAVAVRPLGNRFLPDGVIPVRQIATSVFCQRWRGEGDAYVSSLQHRLRNTALDEILRHATTSTKNHLVAEIFQQRTRFAVDIDLRAEANEAHLHGKVVRLGPAKSIKSETINNKKQETSSNDRMLNMRRPPRT